MAPNKSLMFWAIKDVIANGLDAKNFIANAWFVEINVEINANVRDVWMERWESLKKSQSARIQRILKSENTNKLFIEVKRVLFIWFFYLIIQVFYIKRLVFGFFKV